MDRRKIALWLLIGGGVIAAYFMLFFNIALPGSQVVNDGLMNDRTTGMMFGGILAVIGAILYVTAPPASSKTVAFPQAAPIPPQGFWMDVTAALNYPPLSPPRSQTSLQAYVARLRGMGVQLSDTQSAWAWSHGVPENHAGLFVGYVEAHRRWLDSQKPLHLAWVTPGVKRAAAWVGMSLCIIYVLNVAVQAFRPYAVPEMSGQSSSASRPWTDLKEGMTMADAKGIMGQPTFEEPASNNIRKIWLKWREPEGDVDGFFEDDRLYEAHVKYTDGRMKVLLSD